MHFDGSFYESLQYKNCVSSPFLLLNSILMVIKIFHYLSLYSLSNHSENHFFHLTDQRNSVIFFTFNRACFLGITMNVFSLIFLGSFIIFFNSNSPTTSTISFQTTLHIVVIYLCMSTNNQQGHT